MTTVIFGSVALIMIAVIYLQTVDSLKMRSGIILTMSFPSCAADDTDIKSAIKNIKTSLRKLCIISFILFLPIVFTVKYVSISIIYLFVWSVCFFIAFNTFIKKANLHLLKIKSQKGWCQPECESEIRRVDLNAVYSKNKSAVSKLWFIPAAVITAVNIGLCFYSESFMSVTAIASLFELITVYICYIYSLQVTTKIYCENSEKNSLLNKITTHSWSLLWVLTANIQSVLLFLGGFFIEYIPVIVFLACLFLISGILITAFYIRRTQSKILNDEDEILHCDNDDMYWISGSYSNPNDSRLLVEKRIGIGFTFNMANKKGKIITYTILSSVAVIIGVLIIMFLKLDFGTLDVNIMNDTVYINAPMYSTSFKTDDIENIYTIDDLGDGIKTNGAAAGNYKLGHFYYSKIGNCLMYVYSDTPPYIVVKLKDENIIISLKNYDETQKLLENLEKLE